MIEKFIEELQKELHDNNIEDTTLVDAYMDTFNTYIHLGQSEFDIIRHFGEPHDIVDSYIKTGSIPLPDMDSRMEFAMPTFLAKADEPIVEDVKADTVENVLPTTKAGLICNDIFFVGIGLLIALAGVIALGVVAVFMTAGSIVQMSAVWELATKGQQIGGFFLALMALLISVLFYVIIVWVVRIVIQFMKKYVRDHRENWAKATQTEVNK